MSHKDDIFNLFRIVSRGLFEIFEDWFDILMHDIIYYFEMFNALYVNY